MGCLGGAAQTAFLKEMMTKLVSSTRVKRLGVKAGKAPRLREQHVRNTRGLSLENVKKTLRQRI